MKNPNIASGPGSADSLGDSDSGNPPTKWRRLKGIALVASLAVSHPKEPTQRQQDEEDERMGKPAKVQLDADTGVVTHVFASGREEVVGHMTIGANVRLDPPEKYIYIIESPHPPLTK